MRTSKRLPILGLALLLVVDLALISWALWPESSARQSVAAPLAPAPADTGGSAAGDPEEEPDEVGDPVPLAQLIAGIDRTTVWIAEAGSCASPGTLHVTTTGGDEWTSHPAPGSITRLRPTDGSSAFVVGGDTECDPQVWYTGDGGEAWSDPQSAAAAWGRDPDDPEAALRPRGEPVRPCAGAEVLDLAGMAGGRAAVLCSDGTVLTSTDRGSSWTEVDRREGLAALSMTESGAGAAAGLADGCEGVAVAAISDDAIGEGACIDDAPYAPGQVAISLAGDSVWLLAGTGVWRADGLGEEFEMVGAWPRD